MTIEVRVPQLPESVADATLVSWHKKPGDAVARDENLVDLETDKVVLEVPAPMGGTLTEIRLANGTTVTSGQILAIIEDAPAATVPGASAPAILAAANGAATPAKDAVKEALREEPAAGSAAKLSPAAKRVVEENHVDPKTVAGSGRDGRVSKSDVVNYLSSQNAASAGGSPATGASAASAGAMPAAAAPAAPASAAVPAAAPVVAASARPATNSGSGRGDRRVPMTRLRARIAERMVQAQSTQALLTSFNEVDLTAVNELRARYKESFEKRYSVKLGFMSFFTKACVEALHAFPSVNASVEGNDIVYHDYFDVGVAVSTERGLIVPVLRDADQQTFADIEKSIAAFASRARAGTITIEELTGGTFTITNGGTFGSLLSTPIVNAPQSAILGMHKIQDRAVVIDGQVAVRPMMYVALTYDHRIIDGREAVQFLVTIKQCLEDPARLVLHV
jgi:2-oxoglutarate dehydrogenase E2 component (dihydrolipoamide succinyltransferase)